MIPFIRRNKRECQVIVVTHSVNGILGTDSEEMIIASDQTGCKSEDKEKRFEYRSGGYLELCPCFWNGQKHQVGILSFKGIKQHIYDILEGGEIAFEKRKE